MSTVGAPARPTPRVVRAGFAPVKGTRHQAYDAVTLSRLGPVGDRAWCLVDVDRRRVLRTVQHPSLVAVAAVTSPDGLTLTLPSGAVAAGPVVPSGAPLTCDYWGRPVALDLLDGPHAALLSAHLGTSVRLAAAPPGGVVYAGAVTLVSTGTLHALASRTGLAVDDLAARFRPTFVVEADEPHAEDAWVGAEVDLGPARVRVTSRVPRCAVVDLDPVTGERGGGVLAALATYRPRGATGDLLLGVDAEVVVPGTVTPSPHF
ncbi:MOSC domain-containing protein [Nocardioides sp. zg-579]|uniref:MOSC domain-containing protein n=1 Tax=Nocardioides marmotae TaxID=2663857 RepID=A0A6I3J4I4_9ACTN|nr:MOSC domain-containing protein [Gordonia jinghuaiqii]MTB94012.1 MOSC domain-containing protein [Nocardioides marmotae]QKE03336.1 MOSC domain-containing protein [Nocardioides marmotae]